MIYAYIYEDGETLRVINFDNFGDASKFKDKYVYRELTPAEAAMFVDGLEHAGGDRTLITGDTLQSANVSYTSLGLETIKQQTFDLLAQVRWQREVGGTTLPDGTSLATDRDTQGKLIAVRIKALEDNTYTVNWKGETGFVTLDAPAIIFIADTVQAHVQAQFDWEMAQTALIAAATTVQELRDIVTAWGSE